MTFQSNIPLASDLLSVSQNDIKNNFEAIGTAFPINHVDFNDSGAGKHKYVEMPNQGSDPAGAASEMTLFSKLAGGASQVHYIRDAGSAVQFTGRDPSAGTSGETFLPGGLLLKWGQIAAAGNGVVQNFPTAFPNNCYSVVVTINIGSTLSNIGINGFTRSGFTFRTTAAGNVPITYIAIGN